ncbi:MAG: 2-hydroxyacid dehydrogenase [Candidatus Bathyarchaeota archaeon]|jgi:phosphoglycerate dehydrogenase-like enzyme
MVKHKIASLYAYIPREHQIEKFCCNLDPGTFEFVVIPKDPTEEEIKETISGASMILMAPRSPFLDRARLESVEELRLVQFMSVGYDNIDLEASKELGISVANNAGYNAVAVAEHAIMMILVLLKKAFLAHQGVIQGGWPQQELIDKDKYLYELRGKTLGVLGLGNIGVEVAKRGVAFEARVLYNKRNRLREGKERGLGVEYATLEELLRESDVLSVHTPLTNETRGMIGREQIGMMKTGAILVNTARKGIVDDAAVAEALRSGKLWGVGIDVPRTPEEQDELREIFKGLDNVVLTPHIASGTWNASEQFFDQIRDQITRFTRGEKPLYLLNDVWG